MNLAKLSYMQITLISLREARPEWASGARLVVKIVDELRPVSQQRMILEPTHRLADAQLPGGSRYVLVRHEGCP